MIDMKQIIYIHLIAFFFALSIQKTKAQDFIVTDEARTIACDITNITSDTIFFNMIVNNKSVKTFLNLSQVRDYHIFHLDKIKESLDTNTFYYIKLDDGTSLLGKIKSIEKNKIIFDDNYLNKITVKGEIIKSFRKENPNAYYYITLANGNEISGDLIERRKNEIDIKTESLGKVTLATKDIKKIKEIEKNKIIEGVYWFPNPNATRYFFAPTAISLKKGEGYYQNAYIIGNSINYGISDNISFGGIVILPVAVLITPKIGFPISEKLHIGAGAILGLLPDPTLAGIGYGLITYGTIENNITIGGGYGFFDEEYTEWPIITVNGMLRVSRRIAFVSENWIIPLYDRDYNYNYTSYTKTNYYEAFISYGLRIMKEKITFDLALINSGDIFEVLPIGIPYIDFVYKF